MSWEKDLSWVEIIYGKNIKDNIEGNSLVGKSTSWVELSWVGLKKELSWFEGLSIVEKLISWVELNWVEKGVELSWRSFYTRKVSHLSWVEKGVELRWRSF